MPKRRKRGHAKAKRRVRRRPRTLKGKLSRNYRGAKKSVKRKLRRIKRTL